MNTVSPSPQVSVSSARRWAGPALLLLSAAQYLLGDTLLADYTTRALGFLGVIGLFLAMTSPTVFMAGLGESLNALVEIFSRRN